jgi:hypothetical protein
MLGTPQLYRLKHRIFIHSLLGSFLYRILLFDDFAIIVKSKKIDRNIFIVIRPNLARMQG